MILTATTSLQSKTKSLCKYIGFDAFAILLADGEEVYRTKLQISVPPMDRASYEVPVTLKNSMIDVEKSTVLSYHLY